MEPLLVRVVAALVVVVLTVPVCWVAFKALINGGLRGGLRRALAADAGFALDEEGPDFVRYRGTGSPPVLVCERASTNSRGYTSRLWEVEVGGLEALTDRSTILVGLEGLRGATRNRHHIDDVKVGDRRFDRAFKVGGSDADVVRGVFAHDEVKSATVALFKGVTVLACSAERGRLVVEFLPDHVRGETGRRRVALVVRLARALAMASASAAIKHPTTPMAGASSGSGAPVGIGVARS